MKKTLFIILAGLLLIGLVGCSGILHDKGLLSGGWFVAGTVSEWDPGKYPVVEVSTSEWYFEFTASDTTGQFKVCPGTWDPAYGGVSITVDGAKAKFDSPVNNAPNGEISGLTSGSKYRLVFTAENGALFVQCKSVE